MAIKTIPLRSIEEKVDNIFEAVCVMSGQAKRVLDERILQASIKDAEEEDYGAVSYTHLTLPTICSV